MINPKRRVWFATRTTVDRMIFKKQMELFSAFMVCPARSGVWTYWEFQNMNLLERIDKDRQIHIVPTVLCDFRLNTSWIQQQQIPAPGFNQGRSIALCGYIGSESRRYVCHYVTISSVRLRLSEQVHRTIPLLLTRNMAMAKSSLNGEAEIILNEQNF